MRKFSIINSLRPILLIGYLTLFVFLSLKTEIIAQDTSTESSNKVALKSQVEWTYLNPARKDKAPMAGTLWGDRNGTEATGFLLKPSDGFQSPPHIHNVSYRGIVIQGLIHNDDPNAAEMWMPEGSFWTQPKGEVHITSAKGCNTLAYIEIEQGPYLVKPKDQAFDSGERPVNVDKSNIVWLGASDINWINKTSTLNDGVEVAFLWGNQEKGNLNGTFLKVPSKFNGKIYSDAATFKAIVINGKLQYNLSNEATEKILEPGSYFSSVGKFEHRISSKTDGESIIYIRTNDQYKIITEN